MYRGGYGLTDINRFNNLKAGSFYERLLFFEKRLVYTVSMKKFPLPLVVVSIAILLFGFLIGWFVGNRGSTEVEVVRKNTFFEFVDTFTLDREMGTPAVLLTQPELDSIAFRYATSQESSQFGVYNYRTNTLWMGIGADNYAENQQPVAILSGNRIMMWSEPGVDAIPGTKPQLVVKNFEDEIVDEVRLPSNILPHLHQSYGMGSQAGKLFITVKNTFDHTPTTRYESYEIDESTLSIRKVSYY